MDNPFNLDKHYLEIIEQKFEHKKKIAAARNQQLFGIFNEDISIQEKMALKFLYAYMPLNDLADYDGDMFLKHVRRTLNIRSKVVWGNKVPDHLLLHFIFPYRISNENIEDYRGILFDELYDRVKRLSMYGAILEVNHWCHEKATYVGNDRRTSSPLTVMRTALGRCGEQSALAVMALRSLYIPARQVYTPRWAHCDSNHAWVEGWADGQWYFFGACEPEPKLNRGWFSGPARRAMLVNTRVPTNYPGPEEITLSHEWFTEINLMHNYAKNKKITVKVKDEEENPVINAKVYFELFNFGELSPMLIKTTDVQGAVYLTTGMGDILVHVATDNRWGYKKINVKEQDYIEIIITHNVPKDGIVEIDMVPPAEILEDEKERITDNEKQINDKRLKEEDKIRTDYENTFISRKQAEDIAKGLKLPNERVWNVLQKARGNSHEIVAFLKDETKQYGEWPLKLLESLADKDLTDTFRFDLRDHLINSLIFKDDFSDEIFTRYILCPRIGWEKIRAYKAFFQEQFTDEEKIRFKQSPYTLIKWVDNNIEVLEGYVNYRGSATPRGSFELKKADDKSRDGLFVAMARSFGIPARLEPADKRPQYLLNNVWVDALFITEKQNDYKEDVEIGRVKLIKDSRYEGKIEYFVNFSLARFEDNVFKSLDYYQTDFSQFENYIEVLPGYYRLITGNRLTDGTVLIRMTFFTVESGQTVDIDCVIRKKAIKVEVMGHIQENNIVTLVNGDSKKIDEFIEDKSMVMIWLEPDREPSKHVLRELKELSLELDGWSGNICLCVGDDKLTSVFNPNNYKGLPDKTFFAVDNSYEILKVIKSGLNKKVTKSFPLVFIIDKNKNIRYVSSGYKLGIGRDIFKTVKSLEFDNKESLKNNFI